MEIFLIALTAVIVIVLLFILFTRKGGDEKSRPAPVASRKKEDRPRKTESVKAKEQAASPAKTTVIERKVIPAEVLDAELGVSDIFGDIRKFIQSGIETIYTVPPVSPDDHRMPLTSQNIMTDTMGVVQNQIVNLKNVRSEHFRLQKIVNDPGVQMSDLSKIILADPILTAKILRMANSPYFGMQSKIDSISHALMILGLQNIKNILYREGLLQLFQAGSPKQREAVAALWKHSSLVSVCASFLNDLFNGLNKGTLFTLGILHDIGKLIIIGLPQVQEMGADFWEKYPTDFSILDEDRIMGINHAVIGRIALEQWSFSDLMIHAVEKHHAPSFVDLNDIGLDEEQVQYVMVLFMADQVAKLFTARGNGKIRISSLLPSYHPLIDKNRLIAKIMDTSFLAQIREAEIVAVSEQPGAKDRASYDRSPYTETSSTRTGFQGTTYTGDATVVISSPEPGRTVGRYEIIRELGKGAMGTVFLGKDPLINREVAIKTLRYNDADDDGMAKAKSRFFREAEAIGKLAHPNIVTVYDVGEYQGTAYMAMELLDGSDLAPYCDKKKLPPVPEVVRIVSSVAKALDYAHASGVVHRDIKPGNIRILKKGDVKVVDFGIARVMETSRTHTGVVIGSPSYMSPEQVEGQKVDGRSDLFSLGVVFYELLTGERPFKGNTLTSLLLQITTSQPTPVKTLAPAVPDRCIAVLEKAMAKDRTLRYQTGQEMADDLDACLSAF